MHRGAHRGVPRGAHKGAHRGVTRGMSRGVHRGTHRGACRGVPRGAPRGAREHNIGTRASMCNNFFCILQYLYVLLDTRVGAAQERYSEQQEKYCLLPMPIHGEFIAIL